MVGSSKNNKNYSFPKQPKEIDIVPGKINDLYLLSDEGTKILYIIHYILYILCFIYICINTYIFFFTGLYDNFFKKRNTTKQNAIIYSNIYFTLHILSSLLLFIFLIVYANLNIQNEVVYRVTVALSSILLFIFIAICPSCAMIVLELPSY